MSVCMSVGLSVCGIFSGSLKLAKLSNVKNASGIMIAFKNLVNVFEWHFSNIEGNSSQKHLTMVINHKKIVLRLIIW